jgi:hypothetical protein
MPRKPLPDFESPTTAEMRLLWRAYPDENVHRLMLEIERLRDLLLTIDHYREGIQRCWYEETKTKLAGLEALRVLLQTEKTMISDR